MSVDSFSIKRIDSIFHNDLDCSYYRVLFVCAVGNGSYEFLNILKLLSNCADFECLQEVLCSVSVAIQKGM